MKIPTTLKHKPVIVAPDYETLMGGRIRRTRRGSRLGLHSGTTAAGVDISAKVWRYTGEKWSRQSEELPLHRVIDLALLICRTKQYFMDAYRYPALYDENDPIIDRVGVQGDAMTVEVCTDNERIGEDIKLFSDALVRDDEFLSERLHLLANMLLDMGYGNRRKQ